MRPSTSHTSAGDLVQLIGEKEKSFLVKLEPEGVFQSHLGYIPHQSLIGVEWGSSIPTHLDKPFRVLQPSIDDILRSLNRQTQIIYPKDLGYILLSLNILPGVQVVEAGTGSGALTAAFAYLVGEHGHVFTYDNRASHQTIARQNIKLLGLETRVTFHEQDISEGFLETDAHALFLDLQTPQDFITQARAALVSGGFFGSLIPTTNQVSELITALKKQGFGHIEVSEILHRNYKPAATRLRPVDSMTAHTGYLVFARKLSGAINATSLQE